MWVRSLGQGDPLEEGIATHSSILAWGIPWTEEPGWLQSMGLQRVGLNRVTNTQALVGEDLDMSPWGSPFIPMQMGSQKPNPTSASLAGPGATLLGSG